MTLSKRVKVQCQRPGCGHVSEVDVDFDEIKLPDSSTNTARIKELEDRHTALTAELEEWRTGQRLPSIDTMLSHITSCPECYKRATETLRGSFLKTTSDAEAREIARKHHLWPPPDIEIVGTGSKMRR